MTVRTADFSIKVSFIFCTEFADVFLVTVGGSNDFFPPLNAINQLIRLREIVYCDVGIYVYVFTHMHARALASKILEQTSGVSSSHQNTGKSPNKRMFAIILRYHDRAPTFARPHCRWGHLKPLIYSALN